MKNHELIEKLKALPEDLEVLFWDCDWSYTPIDEIKVLTIVELSSKVKGDEFIREFDACGIGVGNKFIGLS